MAILMNDLAADYDELAERAAFGPKVVNRRDQTESSVRKKKCGNYATVAHTVRRISW